MPTHIARSKRTRIVYVVLLCVAVAMSTWTLYNQVHSDSTSAQFADQISAFCADNPAYSNDHFNCQQARSVQDNGSAIIQGAKGDKGDPGMNGLNGERGLTGDPGLNGVDGERGITGSQGAPGDTGPQGIKGDSGEKGDKGDQGDRGADGDPAPRITDIDTNHDPTNCMFIVTLSDGSTYGVSIGASNCVS